MCTCYTVDVFPYFFPYGGEIRWLLVVVSDSKMFLEHMDLVENYKLWLKKVMIPSNSNPSHSATETAVGRFFCTWRVVRAVYGASLENW